MNKLNEKNTGSGRVTMPDSDTTAGPRNGAPTFIKMESAPDQKPIDPDRGDDNNNDNNDNKTTEEAIKEPLIPVPAQDEINPPLSATLGGDDVVIPLDKK